jgi:hypothetical protein
MSLPPAFRGGLVSVWKGVVSRRLGHVEFLTGKREQERKTDREIERDAETERDSGM